MAAEDFNSLGGYSVGIPPIPVVDANGNVVTNILQNQLGFEGLVFTDALNMKGASNYKKAGGVALAPGDIDLEAFLAAQDKLADLHIVSIDDTDFDTESAGKDRLLTPHLLENGYIKVLWGRQTVFIKNKY